MTTLTNDREPLKVPDFVCQERAKLDAVNILRAEQHYGHNIDVTTWFIWCSDCMEFINE